MAAKNRSKSKQAEGLDVLKSSGAISSKDAKALAKYAAGVFANAKAARLAAEAKERAGIRLTRKQANAATSALSEAHNGLRSCVTLARNAVGVSDPSELDALMAAIESLSMVGCRRVDAVARLLGDPGIGDPFHELDGTAEGLAV